MEKTIKDILNKLEDNGFPSYLVGGYVRDALLGIESYDIDICTKALPKNIHQIFSSTNNNYGSINLSVGKYNVDITTFRKDYDYVNRHPSKVEYISSLEEDLKRRDFTVNAICMDKNGKIIDPLNGVDDLNKKILKVIGNTDAKLKEDPLRMLRAIRFAATKGFVLEKDLLIGIENNANLIKTLSNYRIKEELDKILLNKNYLIAFDLMEKTKISKIIGLEYHNINFVDDLLGMWSQVKVNNMPFTNNEKSNIIKITEVVNYGNIDSKILFKYGLYISTIAGKILNINPSTISDMFNEMPLKSREDLRITGSELKGIIGSGKIIGDTMDLLISLILDGRLNNKKEDIIEFLKKGK